MGSLRHELEELLGEDGLRVLSGIRGGRRARIPKRVPGGHWLAEALGRERAEALAFRFGGCRIDIPRRPVLSDRNDTIRRLRSRGWSMPRIAAEVGLSERQVRRVIDRVR